MPDAIGSCLVSACASFALFWRLAPTVDMYVSGLSGRLKPLTGDWHDSSTAADSPDRRWLYAAVLIVSLSGLEFLIRKMCSNMSDDFAMLLISRARFCSSRSNTGTTASILPL